VQDERYRLGTPQQKNDPPEQQPGSTVAEAAYDGKEPPHGFRPAVPVDAQTQSYFQFAEVLKDRSHRHPPGFIRSAEDEAAVLPGHDPPMTIP
jgi:hypothetical protein